PLGTVLVFWHHSVPAHSRSAHLSHSLPFFHMTSPPPFPALFPYTTLFRSLQVVVLRQAAVDRRPVRPGQKRPHLFVHSVLHNRRSEEHTSELQSRFELVCRLLLEKNNHNESRYNNID